MLDIPLFRHLVGPSFAIPAGFMPFYANFSWTEVVSVRGRRCFELVKTVVPCGIFWRKPGFVMIFTKKAQGFGWSWNFPFPTLQPVCDDFSSRFSVGSAVSPDDARFKGLADAYGGWCGCTCDWGAGIQSHGHGKIRRKYCGPHQVMSRGSQG